TRSTSSSAASPGSSRVVKILQTVAGGGVPGPAHDPSRPAIEAAGHQRPRRSRTRRPRVRRRRSPRRRIRSPPTFISGDASTWQADQACGARKRAITQQPADRAGIDVVGPRHIRLRFPSGKALHGLLALVWRQLGRTTEPNAASLGTLTTLARPDADELAL